MANDKKAANDALYTITTPIFRGAFMDDLFTGKDMIDEKSKETFKAYPICMLFEKGEQLLAVKELGRKLMTELWGPDPKIWPQGWLKPWRDQADKAKDNPNAQKTYDGFESGALCMNATSYRDLATDGQIFDQKGGIITAAKLNGRPLVYSGALLRANITLKWFDNKAKGLKCQLNAVQLIRDGKPLGGGSVSFASAFSPVDVDATQGAAAVFSDIDPMS